MGLASQRVAPFGHLGIIACVPLPRAYRSLPRPSSPLCAQASPTYLHSLDSFPLLRNKCSSKARATTLDTSCAAQAFLPQPLSGYTVIALRLTEVLRPLPLGPSPMKAIPLTERPTIISILPLSNSVCHVQARGITVGNRYRDLKRTRRATKSGTFRPPHNLTIMAPYSSLRKGGDPAAGSPTATLLRLRPSHCARLRRLGPLRVPTPTSGAHSFHGVTGGVYKARERIHRGVADPRLLAIPASCRRVADDNPN